MVQDFKILPLIFCFVLVNCKVNERSCKAKEKAEGPCNFETNPAAVLKDIISDSITLDENEKKKSVEVIEKVDLGRCNTTWDKCL